MVSYRDKLMSFNGSYMPESEEDDIWNDQESEEEDDPIVEEDMLEDNGGLTCPTVRVSRGAVRVMQTMEDGPYCEAFR